MYEHMWMLVLASEAFLLWTKKIKLFLNILISAIARRQVFHYFSRSFNYHYQKIKKTVFFI